MHTKSKKYWKKVEVKVNILYLPMDCHQKLAEYLDLQSLSHLKVANRQFYWLIVNLYKSDYFWKRKLEIDYQLYTTKTIHFKKVYFDVNHINTMNGYRDSKYSYSNNQELVSLFKDNFIFEPFLLYVKDRPIKNIIAGNDSIFIYFHHVNFCLELVAYAECCSESWFEITNYETIIGKSIISINDIGSLTLPEDRGGGAYNNHLIRIDFKNGEFFEFALRNLSNGYYDGELEINIKSLL